MSDDKKLKIQAGVPRTFVEDYTSQNFKDAAVNAVVEAGVEILVVQSFETISKNLKSWNATLNYTSEVLTSIVYTSGTSTVTKTFNYTDGLLTSIVLSGDTPSGIDLTKTLVYTSGVFSSFNYS